MHFEILVEDQSGKRALDILMPKIVSDPHTFQVIGYRGIGRLPQESQKRIGSPQAVVARPSSHAYCAVMARHSGAVVRR